MLRVKPIRPEFFHSSVFGRNNSVLHEKGLVGLIIASRMTGFCLSLMLMDMENVSIAGELSHLGVA